MKLKQHIKPFLYGLVSGLLLLLLIKCNGDGGDNITEPKRTTIRTEYITKTDTITKTVISKPKVRYITRTNDSIIYKPSKEYINEAGELISTEQVNVQDVTLTTDNGIAELSITTTGEVLDVTGNITSTNEVKTITNEVTKKTNKSGLFLYGQTSVKPVVNNYTVGLDYQIKNKVIIGTSATYNNQFKTTHINLKLGIKIF